MLLPSFCRCTRSWTRSCSSTLSPTWQRCGGGSPSAVFHASFEGRPCSRGSAVMARPGGPARAAGRGASSEALGIGSGGVGPLALLPQLQAPAACRPLPRGRPSHAARRDCGGRRLPAAPHPRQGAAVRCPPASGGPTCGAELELEHRLPPCPPCDARREPQTHRACSPGAAGAPPPPIAGSTCTGWKMCSASCSDACPVRALWRGSSRDAAGATGGPVKASGSSCFLMGRALCCNASIRQLQ